VKEFAKSKLICAVAARDPPKTLCPQYAGIEVAFLPLFLNEIKE